MQKLASGSWPLLKRLAIGGTFELRFFAEVAGSSWPLLETMQLSCGYCAPQVVSKFLQAVERNVKHMQIMARKPSLRWLLHHLWHASMAKPYDTGVPNLQSLGLSCSSIIESGFRQLARGRWPLLSKLDISKMHYGSFLLPDDYAAFGDWPILTYLSLAHNGMNDACAVQLTKGHRPLLATIDLSHNNVGAEGGAGIPVAHWPHLKHLCLHGNKPECCRCFLARHIQMPSHMLPKFTPC